MTPRGAFNQEIKLLNASYTELVRMVNILA